MNELGAECRILCYALMTRVGKLEVGLLKKKKKKKKKEEERRSDLIPHIDVMP